jgi:hypothetical protein
MKVELHTSNEDLPAKLQRPSIQRSMPGNPANPCILQPEVVCHTVHGPFNINTEQAP